MAKSLQEISSELLSRYKEKAKKSADDLAAKGEYKKSTSRWGNIMKATGKQIEKTTANIRKNLNKEEFEQVDELNVMTLSKYAAKARSQSMDKNNPKRYKRGSGAAKAYDKIHRGEYSEEVEHILEYESDLAKMKKSDSYKVGDKVWTKVGGQWHRGHITTPLNKAGNHGVKFHHKGMTHSTVSNPHSELRLNVEEVEQVDEISRELTHSYFKKAYAQKYKNEPTKPTKLQMKNRNKGMGRATSRLMNRLELPKGVDPSEGGKYTADSVEYNDPVIVERYTEDDIANGGTVIYKHEGKHYMSKVSHKTGGGAGTKIHTTSKLGHVVPLNHVVSTDASDWNTYKNRPVNEAKQLKNMSYDEIKQKHDDVADKIKTKGGVSTGHPLAKQMRILRGAKAFYHLKKDKSDNVKEEQEINLDEKLNPSMGAGEYVKDFKKSDAPQFKGKSKAKRRVMAIAAYLNAKKGMNESSASFEKDMDTLNKARLQRLKSQKKVDDFKAQNNMEEVEQVKEATHRIGLTVTDPQHPMVSKRKETIQKTVRVTGSDREKAITSAIMHYRRKGYKVHDHHYIGVVKEEAELDEASKRRSIEMVARKDAKNDTASVKNREQGQLKMNESDMCPECKEDPCVCNNVQEAVTVKKQTHSWGKMITVHKGADTSYPLHPEHQKAIKRLRPSGEHSKTSFKDETGRMVHAHREGDKVHLVSHGARSDKTTVDYKHFDESNMKTLKSLMQDIEEGRGRPRKNPTDPKWSKGKAKSGDDEEHEYGGEDSGKEPDQHVHVQLSKARDAAHHEVKGKEGFKTKGGADVKFDNGKTHFVKAEHAHAVLSALQKVKPEARSQLHAHIAKSHDNFMAVHKMVSGGK